MEALRQQLEQQPVIGPLVHQVMERFKLEEQLANIGKTLASRASGILSGSVNVVVQLGITLFVLFFLYRDYRQATQAVRELLPVSQPEADRLFHRVASTIHATVNGSLVVALVQALLAGIVYAALSVPGAVLWATATFFAALIPVAGTFLIWAPIALYLGLTGAVGKALFLVTWGVLVVGTIDNVLYPYLVGDKLRLHTVPTFFAIVGGISIFGASGLILGPLVLALTIAVLDVWWRRTEDGRAAEEAVSPTAAESSSPAAVLQERGA
jgi:predicted PurR-regulated permease PerM